MKAIALSIGLIIATLGMVGLVTPEVLLSIGGQFATPTGLFIGAFVRVVLGLLFIKVAVRSRFPFGMRLLGVFVVVAGLVTPFVGVDGARAWMAWGSERGPLLQRSWAVFAIALGLFIVTRARPDEEASVWRARRPDVRWRDGSHGHRTRLAGNPIRFRCLRHWALPPERTTSNAIATALRNRLLSTC